MDKITAYFYQMEKDDQQLLDAKKLFADANSDKRIIAIKDEVRIDKFIAASKAQNNCFNLEELKDVYLSRGVGLPCFVYFQTEEITDPYIYIGSYSYGFHCHVGLITCDEEEAKRWKQQDWYNKIEKYPLNYV